MAEPNWEEYKSALPDDEGWHQAEESMAEFGDPAAHLSLPPRCAPGEHKWRRIMICETCLDQPGDADA